MKNNKKGDSAKIEIELLLQKALRVQQEPSQQLNDSIIRQYEKELNRENATSSEVRTKLRSDTKIGREYVR